MFRMFSSFIFTSYHIYYPSNSRNKNIKNNIGGKIMKEIKYVFIGKAKDFNAFNITVETIKKMEAKEKNEKNVK